MVISHVTRQTTRQRFSATRSLAMQAARRPFSSTATLRSNIGRKLVLFNDNAVSVLFAHPYKPLHANVNAPPKAFIDPRKPYLVEIKGPYGSLSRMVPAFVRLDIKNAAPPKPPNTTLTPPTTAKPNTAEPAPIPPTKAVAVTVDFPELKSQKAMWGTTRALLQSMITGVTERHIVSIRLVGVGFRAALDETRNVLQLKLGFSNTIELPVPYGVEVKILAQDSLQLKGLEKNSVTQFAANIRKWRKPEPYNQKGIFVNDEKIAKKKGKKR